jgi:uncharacterized protein (DUF1800 family)
MSIPVKTDPTTVVHFLNRAGFGPRPGQVKAVAAKGLDAYLAEQLNPTPDPALDKELIRVNKHLGYATSQIIDIAYKRIKMPSELGNVVEAYHTRRMIRALSSKNQLEEALADFWYNHFNVNARVAFVRLSVLSYENTAVRPHVLGRFRDLLGATARHPSMLCYLDNYLSRKDRVVDGVRKLGLNENYGRELMELHTLGVTAGYTQDDVVAAARCFTGWTIDGLRISPEQTRGKFVYAAADHDTEPKKIFGLELPAGGGIEDGEKLLDHLAAHPATAHFVCTKLARRFVADDPPAALVDRCAATFSSTGGDIRKVMRTLFESPEFWSEESARKLKTPLEYVVSCLRATGADLESAEPGLTWHLDNMGMRPYLCTPPTGYSDRGADWLSPSYVHRLNFALDLGNDTIQGVKVGLADTITRMGGNPGRASSIASFFNREVFGGKLSQRTLDAVKVPASQSPTTLAKVAGLVLASPEMQWR